VAGAVLIPLLSSIAFSLGSVELVVGSSLTASAANRSSLAVFEAAFAAAPGIPVSAPAIPEEVASISQRPEDRGEPQTSTDPAISRASEAKPQSTPRPSPASGGSQPAGKAPPPTSTSAPIATVPTHERLIELPGVSTAAPDPMTSPSPSADAGSKATATVSTPWGVAADAGVSVGKGSQKAAVATAGFFTRMGKSIAGAF
jgi:hypothetical protein